MKRIVRKAMEKLKSIARLSLNQRATLGISFAALLLGAVNAYYQFFYEKESLLVAIPFQSFDEAKAQYSFTIVFINNGTVPISITGARIDVNGQYELRGSWNLAEAIRPFVIPKGDILIKTVPVSVPLWNRDKLRDPKNLPAIMNLVIDTIDGHGRMRETTQGEMRWDYDREFCNVFSLLDRDPRNALRDNEFVEKANSWMSTGYYKASVSCSPPASSSSTTMTVSFDLGTPEHPIDHKF